MTGSIWTRPSAAATAPAPRSTLTRAGIVEAAVAVADAEGLDAVSIRRVAADLKARPMSLYNHIERKDDLVELMVDHVVAESLLGDALAGGWRQALRQIADATRATALRHPWVVELLGRIPALGPNAQRHREESLAAVAELAASEQDKLRLLIAVDTYVSGQVALEIAMRAAGDTALSRELPPDGFAAGLEWLLDGAEAALDRRAG